MKFIASSKHLYKKFKPLIKTINSSTVLPILEDFLVEVTQGRATFTATDLETVLSVTVEVESKEEGAICVPAKLLFNLVRDTEEQPLTFITIGSGREQTLQVVGDNFTVTMPTESAENYPKTPATKTTGATLDAAELTGILRKALPFISTDQLRPSLTGLYLHERESKLWVAATDAHRLFWQPLPLPAGWEGISMILPAKSIRIILEAGPKDSVSIVKDSPHVHFAFDNYRMAARLIDVNFPQYEVVIPQVRYEFHLSRRETKAFLKMAQHFTNKSTRQMKIKVDSKGRYLTVDTNDLDFSFGFNGRLRAYNFNEQVDFTFAINLSFLQAVVNLTKDEYMRVQHTGMSTSALIIDNNVLIMPLMLNE